MPSSPILLALDTSTQAIGLALYDGTHVLYETAWNSPDHHTVELAPAVETALQKARLKASALNALAVAIGPGSFTGLRIGLALAKGLALVRNIPIVGIPTLDVVAAAQSPAQDILLAAVLRAGRGRLATGWYRAQHDAWQPCQPIEVLTPPDLAQRIAASGQLTLVCGELGKEERRLFEEQGSAIRLASPAQCLRRPAFLAELGWQRWRAGQVDNPATLAPIYLHYNDPIPE